MKILFWGLALQGLLFFFPRPLPAADSEPPDYRRSFAAGFGYTGILFRKGLGNAYSGEFHYLLDFNDSGSDEISVHVFGLRGYRHFRTDRRLQYFVGMEGAYLLAKSRIQSANGFAVGGFAGLEYYLTRRISLGFDLGPYYVRFKDKDFGTSGGGTDFVLNSFLNFYFL